MPHPGNLGSESPSLAPGETPAEAGWAVPAAALAIAAATVCVYSGSFAGPFVLDDLLAIPGNPSIRHLSTALSAPAGSPVAGRPLLNLTFALNYWAGGYTVWGYHALNLGVHVLCALALLGLVRQTLLGPALAARFGRNATAMGFAAAALWAVHPLQTESVAYVSQRAEELMGLAYLLTVYCFARSSGARRPRGWLCASVLCCLAGSLTKEVIVTAPVAVLLYDRTFRAGSFGRALRQRWAYYLGLASTWPVLAWLMAGAGDRGVGYAHGISPWDYALTSCRSLWTYLVLAVRPAPLVFDYGTQVIRHPGEAAPFAAVVACLLAVTFVALRRRPALGFVLAWFFLVLAPTTSLIPVGGQPMAEHRMYLPLVAIAVLVVVAVQGLGGRRWLLAIAVACCALGGLSVLRIREYRSAASLWKDTVSKAPGNARAHAQYGVALADVPGSLPEALSQFREAIAIEPGLVEAHVDLGNALAQTPRRLGDAMAQFGEAIRLDPENAQAHDSLGVALAGLPGRASDAIGEFSASVRLRPGFEKAHLDLGHALALSGRQSEAVPEFQAALRAEPGRADLHVDLALALEALPGRVPEAIGEFETALRLEPDSPVAHNGLGVALAQTPGRLPEAVAQFEEALRIRPGFAAARENLEHARQLMGAR